MIGGTKQNEYRRTIEVIQEILAKERPLITNVMFMLYLLADSGYNNKDLYELAEKIKEQIQK